MGSAFLKQGFFITKPTLTEKTLPDQSGKVSVSSRVRTPLVHYDADIIDKIFIVTGGYAGCGWELTKILYQHNATIHVAGRSADKAADAISEIRKLLPDSKGKMVFLKLDLADLSTIKASADEFLSKETKLDVLWNNAGVMWPPRGSKSTQVSTQPHQSRPWRFSRLTSGLPQGFELQMATNCLGPFLFTELLYPILAFTAKTAPSNSVRICWAASLSVDLAAPKGGISLDSTGAFLPNWTANQQYNYACSKAGNYFYANEFPIHHPDSPGIVSVCFNPGNLNTELQRHVTYPGKSLINKMITHPPVFGGYTELWAGLAPELTTADNGLYIAPWGRKWRVRNDIEASLKTKEGEGNGIARTFWEWGVRETKPYM
jgi:retinol dehydrogenase-12